MVKILIASPIKQQSNILKEFLVSLIELNKDACKCDYIFIDDYNQQESFQLLSNFAKTVKNVRVIPSSMIMDVDAPYLMHGWNNALIEKVACLKNYIIDTACNEEYDYLFFIDSDIVLHKETLQRLLSVNREIVSNVFWTRVSKCDDYEPQVWLMDQGALFDPSDSRTKNAIYRTAKKMEFISRLKDRGTFRVGGLGACTLISRKVLLAGVNFAKLYNISFWGEDRAFCIRAVSAGFDLYVDTYYPAYHIYRESYLVGVEKYKRYGFSFSEDIEKLTILDKFKRNIRRMKIIFRCFIYNISHVSKIGK